MQALPYNYALQAHPLVKWLLDNERDVKAAVYAYLLGQGDSHIPVAGPPSEVEMLRRLRDPRHQIALPVINLYCQKISHATMRQHAVEVSCSRDDLELIWHWQKRQQSQH